MHLLPNIVLELIYFRVCRQDVAINQGSDGTHPFVFVVSELFQFFVQFTLKILLDDFVHFVNLLLRLLKHFGHGLRNLRIESFADLKLVLLLIF